MKWKFKKNKKKKTWRIHLTKRIKGQRSHWLVNWWHAGIRMRKLMTNWIPAYMPMTITYNLEITEFPFCLLSSWRAFLNEETEERLTSLANSKTNKPKNRTTNQKSSPEKNWTVFENVHIKKSNDSWCNTEPKKTEKNTRNSQAPCCRIRPRHHDNI